MRKFFTFFIPSILFTTCIMAQSNFFAITSGPWSSASTWSNTRGGSAGSTVPGSGDFVFTEGFQITVGDFFSTGETVTCANLAISFNTANSILSGSIFGSSEVVIENVLVAYDHTQPSPVPTVPNTAVIQNSPTLEITLTGTSFQAIQFWSVDAPFYNLNLNPGAGIMTFGSPIAIGGGTLNLLSGTFVSNFGIQDASLVPTSVLNVSSGAIMTVNSPITGDGSTSSKFNQITVDGTVNANTYINFDNFSLNASGQLNVGFSGVNQERGWWFTNSGSAVDAAPTTINIDLASTVNFNASANQNIPAISYGNLILNANSAASKTVNGSGAFIVNGDFTVNSSNVTFNSTAANTTNLDFKGDIINFGDWGTFVNENIRLNGTTAQDISGGDPINIQNINLLIANPAGVTVSNNLDLDQNLTINSGTLTLDANLNVAGDFTNNGGFLQNTGTVTFDGSTLQTLSGTATTNFGNVTINNSLDNDGTVNISGIMTLGANVILDANGGNNQGSLTLLSTASGTARVAALPTGAFIGGDVTVQRYLEVENAGVPIFRYISSPVEGARVNNWSDDNSLANTDTYFYDETVAGESFQGWTSVNPGTALTPGQGFASLADASIPITLDLTGELTQGTVVVDLDYTDGVNDEDVGWNLVGNPYASAIDWDLITRTASVDPGVAVSDNGATGGIQYHFWDGSVGTLTNGRIASGQSFWVLANAAGQSITINESSKTTTSTVFYRESDVVPDVLSITLTDELGVNDATFIRLRQEATADFDQSIDIAKRINGIFNLASYSDDGSLLAINAYDQLPNGKAINLDLFNINPGNYTFAIDNSFEESTVFTLLDNYLGEQAEITLSDGEAFEYTFDVNDDSKSYGAERFEILVGRRVITDLPNDLFEGIKLFPNPIGDDDFLNVDISGYSKSSIKELELQLIDRKGAILSQQYIPAGERIVQLNMSQFTPGVYILQLIDERQTHHFKVIKN